ncbi:MAG: hypothetical protein IPJ46_13625 [Anaerolineales bacterium]|nr:hypothetical protein [Anaerolineales bacterium]
MVQDFNWQLRAARDLLAGNDPYGYIPWRLNIPYPLPTAMLLPSHWQCWETILAGVFFWYQQWNSGLVDFT